MTIEYKITHYLQPTNHSCSQTAVAMLLSHYGEILTPEDILAKAGVNQDESGNDIGTVNQDLATVCISLGYEVTIHSADFQLLDISWAGLSRQSLQDKLRLVLPARRVAALGDFWSQQYLHSYINFLEKGGELKITAYFSEQYFDELLVKGPFLCGVCPGVLYSLGHDRVQSGVIRESVPDDINGEVGTHSVIVYGKSDSGQYLVADPWYGDQEVAAEALVAGCAAAQIECDNLIVAVKKRVKS